MTVRNGSATPSVIGLPTAPAAACSANAARCLWNDVGRDEADDEGAETDEEPLTQLFEVLDQRRLLAVVQATRKTLHGGP